MTFAGCDSSLLSSNPYPDLTTADVLYLNELQQAGYTVNTPASAAGLIRTAKGTCAALDTGTAVAAASKELAEHIGPSDASVVVVAAIHTYCPRHTALLGIPPR
jgi:hypothetical protein